MTFLPILLGNQWSRLAMAVVVTALVTFSYGFLKGHERANASYWQEAAKVARQAAEDKERLAKEDAARAEIAEAALTQSQSQLESLLHDTKATDCRLSPDALRQLRDLAAGKRAGKRPVS